MRLIREVSSVTVRTPPGAGRGSEQVFLRAGHLIPPSPVPRRGALSSSSSGTVTGRIPSFRREGSRPSRTFSVSLREWQTSTAHPFFFASATAFPHWRRIASGAGSSSKKTSRSTAGTPAFPDASSPSDPDAVALSTKKYPISFSAAAKASIDAGSVVKADPMWFIAPTACGTSRGHPGEPLGDLLAGPSRRAGGTAPSRRPRRTGAPSGRAGSRSARGIAPTRRRSGKTGRTEGRTR